MAPREATRASSVDFVRSLERGLAVLTAFEGHEHLSASDVAAATGLTRAAVRRFLLTLADLGYVNFDGRAFRLAPRILELPSAYLRALALPDIALPHLRALVADVRESASLAVLDGEDVVYVEQVVGHRVLAVPVVIGGRDSAPATSLGRVLLANKPDDWIEDFLRRVPLARFTDRTIVDPKRLAGELGRVRRQGWALVDEELEEGLRAVAAPIADGSGNVVAAANVALHASRWPIAEIKLELLPRLLQATQAITADFGVQATGAGLRDDMPPAAAAARSSDFVQSLERGLATICAFSGSTAPLKLSQVAVRAGLARAAARRFLLTLTHLGYVGTDGRSFWLTAKVLEIGRGYLERATLADIAQPHLRALADRTDESVSLAALDGLEIVYLANESTPRILSVVVPVGGRDPAWVTSLGRVLLAGLDDDVLEERLREIEIVRFTQKTLRHSSALRTELDQARSRGWSLVDEEFEEGLRALAVPVRDHTGRAVAAINFSVNARRWPLEKMRSRLIPELLTTADAIERELARARIVAVDAV